MVRILVPNRADAQGIRLRIPDVSVQVWAPTDPVDPPDAEILLLRRPPRYDGLRKISGIHSLVLIQLVSIGYEWLGREAHASATVSNGAGTCEDSAAEVAVMHVLGCVKRMSRSIRDARRRQWVSRDVASLRGARVAVLGAGKLGTAISDRLLAFAPATITLYARRERWNTNGLRVLPACRLTRDLPDFDIIILALPSNSQTRYLMDRSLITKLRSQSILVNVGRGDVVDTAALLGALQRRKIWAGLDVVDPEPLPRNHPLWSAPNLLLSPHVGGNTPLHQHLAYNLVADQVLRLRQGRPFVNVVRQA